MLPGDCVLTTYGVAVVTHLCADSHDGSLFCARLWRIPGKSIASSSYAYLRKDSVLKSLPAAPGMVTTLLSDSTTETKVLLWTYSSQYNVFTATKIDTVVDEKEDPTSSTAEQEFLTLTPNEIQPAKCAKFYPFMIDLMIRGDQAASAATAIISSNPSLQLLMNTKSSVDLTTVVGDASEAVGEISEKVEKVASRALQSVVLPDASQIQQVVTMLKDDELTTLLEKGRDRLRQLMTDDIPQVTEKACADLGITFAPYSSSGHTLVMTREKALLAINELLAEHTGGDINIENLTETMVTQFSAMFDTLSEAARSDAQLGSIFETISEITSEWQQATGRVMATKSANLFLEGTQRLQARAANIFSPEQLSWARDSSLKLTKEFTEGDAALARLKSIELGDAVRKKLFAAIELRSGSKGGLDGIIASALTSINASTQAAGEVVTKSGVQMMLANLQKTASVATQNAHETLLATLARKSQFRDLVLLKIEESMVSMASYFSDDDITAEELSKIASGEGGTAAIFDPLARKAAKEIEKQLDLAEKNFGSTDPMALVVLSRVRQIVSGDLSISALTDELVKILNDESAVSAGEQMVLQGERFLDAIESASKNKYIGDIIQVVEKAGLTKEGVVKQLETLDMNQVVNVAESAVSDENTRKEILSSAADSALDFILRILPSMPIPPFDGVKDGLIYHLSNLSMEGFKVRKEDIKVEICGQLITAADENLERDYTSAEDTDDDLVPNIPESSSTKASELLIIDVRNISAIFEDAVWSFEQTYFPYFKGDGKAFVQLWEGSIRLQFDLRKRRVAGEDSVKWEPVLCLHEHSVCIRELELRLIGEGRILWFLNKIASMLKVPLSNFVVKSVKNTIGNSSGVLLERLNDTLGKYWPFIINMSGLQLDDLPETTAKDVTKPVMERNTNEVELVWREKVPLGINLLMGDGSGLIKVIDFPRGSQARSVVDKMNLNADAFKGATITAVNGNRYDSDSQEELIDSLRDPGRPKSITFLLSDTEEAERVRLFCSNLQGVESYSSNEHMKETTSFDEFQKNDLIKVVTLTDDGPIGVQFSNSPDDFCLVVEGFAKGEQGSILQAECSQLISIGDLLVSINESTVLGERGSGRSRALSIFESVGSMRPLKLGFVRPYLQNVVMIGSPNNRQEEEKSGPKYELLLSEESYDNDGPKKIVIAGFEGVAGAIEKANVFIGDSLIFLNGEPIGAASRQLGVSSKSLKDINAALQNECSYPMSLMFARAKKCNRWLSESSLDIANATKFNVAVRSKDELGCEFEVGSQHDDIVVKNFFAVVGPIQHFFLGLRERRDWKGISIESIDGQLIPSYASGEVVLNAMQQNWRKKERLELILCDNFLKRRLRDLAEQNCTSTN